MGRNFTASSFPPNTPTSSSFTNPLTAAMAMEATWPLSVAREHKLVTTECKTNTREYRSNTTRDHKLNNTREYALYKLDTREYKLDITVYTN